MYCLMSGFLLAVLKHCALCPDRMLALHLVDKANPVGRIIMRVRDTCNSDPAAFEEYKVRGL